MSSQNRETIHAILIADSRASNFPSLDTDKHYTYVPHYISIPGAKITNLLSQSLEEIEQIPKENTKLLIKIAAGINDLTVKRNNGHGYELAPSSTTTRAVLNRLLNIKEEIKKKRPDAIISFVTIPPINFYQQLRFWVDKKRLQKPIYDYTKRKTFQTAHEITIADINKNINSLNHRKQHGVTCQTASWHTEVLKTQKGKTKLIACSLYDGVHGTIEVKKKWHAKFHQAIQKEIKQIQDLGNNNNQQQ